MRNMSFMLTTRQMRERTKIVTRRTGWHNLKVNDLICAVEKGQGLKPGEKIKRICIIRIVGVVMEPLRRMIDDRGYGLVEVMLEGFPDESPEWFVDMFCRANSCSVDAAVRRIEFAFSEGF